MKIQVSKVMVKALNEYARDMGRVEHFTYNTCNWDTYRLHVNSDILNNAVHDYISSTGVMKYITVTHPSNYYAADAYLSTRDLNRVFEPGMTYSEFMESVFNYVAI